MRTMVVALISIGLLLNTSAPMVAAEETDCEELLNKILDGAAFDESIEEPLEEFVANCEVVDDLLSPTECEHDTVYAESASGVAWWTWKPWPDQFITDFVTIDVEWGWAEQGHFIQTRCDWIVTNLEVKGDFGKADCEYKGFNGGDEYEGSGVASGRDFTCGGLGGSIISGFSDDSQDATNPCLFGGRIYDTQDRLRGVAELGAGLCQGSGVGFDV